MMVIECPTDFNPYLVATYYIHTIFAIIKNQVSVKHLLWSSVKAQFTTCQFCSSSKSFLYSNIVIVTQFAMNPVMSFL